MIKDYDNDEVMANYGRACAKYKAIREAKEAMRDIAVGIGNAIDDDGVRNLQSAMNMHLDNLIQCLLIK